MKSATWQFDLTVIEIIGGKTLKVIHPVTGTSILLDREIKFEGPGAVPTVEKGAKIRVRFEHTNPCGWRKVPRGGRRK